MTFTRLASCHVKLGWYKSTKSLCRTVSRRMFEIMLGDGTYSSDIRIKKDRVEVLL